ncbi:MAG: hypothetical protein JXA93_06610, partial [Anaerolineae bacterium]|nr:hypothetical protein [Anaerolineae bacterium]
MMKLSLRSSCARAVAIPVPTGCAIERNQAAQPEIAQNLGSRPLRALTRADFPDAGPALGEVSTPRPPG